MEKIIEKAIKDLVEKGGWAIKSEDALRFSQAALNLEHVLAVKANIEIEKLVHEK
jgi:hypothetical protein